MGEREVKRTEIREAEHARVIENLEFIGDPFDQMDLQTKKHHALFMYYQILKVRFTMVVVQHSQLIWL